MNHKTLIVVTGVIIFFTYLEAPVYVTAFTVALTCFAYQNDQRGSGDSSDQRAIFLAQMQDWPRLWTVKHTQAVRLNENNDDEIISEQEEGDDDSTFDMIKGRSRVLCEAGIRKGHAEFSNRRLSAAEAHYRRCEFLFTESFTVGICF